MKEVDIIDFSRKPRFAGIIIISRRQANKVYRVRPTVNLTAISDRLRGIFGGRWGIFSFF